jgi:lipopolysaccharide transport system permease protein
MKNTHATPGISPIFLVRGLWQNKHLIGQMTKRDVATRYRGSVIGIAWSLVTPILMLVVYTFVFSVVFGARWTTNVSERQADFAVVLFVGMIVFGFFAEAVNNRAPSLIVTNVNYVKKVVFPLEILPVISIGSTLFHSFISVLVLIAALILTKGGVEPTALFFPIIFLPFVIGTLGVVWFVAALGVYIRDLAQAVVLVTTAFMFLSPVFYPVSALPENFQVILFYNPLTFAIEQSRAVVIFGEFPDWNGLIAYTMASLVVSWCGFFCFQRVRQGFADVL